LGVYTWSGLVDGEDIVGVGLAEASNKDLKLSGEGEERCRLVVFVRAHRIDGRVLFKELASCLCFARAGLLEVLLSLGGRAWDIFPCPDHERVGFDRLLVALLESVALVAFVDAWGGGLCCQEISLSLPQPSVDLCAVTWGGHVSRQRGFGLRMLVGLGQRR
jgi:hypothetical protein